MSSFETLRLETLRLETKDSYAVLTFARPEKRNALSERMWTELPAALAEAVGDPAMRAVVVTGDGPVFQAGADIGELGGLTPLGADAWIGGVMEASLFMERLPAPTIAAIEGGALGGGMEMALACTLRVMAQGAILSLPEVRLGLIPGAGGMERVTALAGPAVAADMALTGRRVSADEALALGLVNRVVPDGQALAEAEQLAADIGAMPRTAVALIMESLNTAKAALEPAMRLSAKNCALCFGTAEAGERMAAFLEGKKP